MKAKELIDELLKYPDDMEIISYMTDGLHDYYCPVSKPGKAQVCEITKHPQDKFVGNYVDAGFAKYKTSNTGASEPFWALII